MNYEHVEGSPTNLSTFERMTVVAWRHILTFLEATPGRGNPAQCVAHDFRSGAYECSNSIPCRVCQDFLTLNLHIFPADTLLFFEETLQNWSAEVSRNGACGTNFPVILQQLFRAHGYLTQSIYLESRGMISPKAMNASEPFSPSSHTQLLAALDFFTRQLRSYRSLSKFVEAAQVVNSRLAQGRPTTLDTLITGTCLQACARKPLHPKDVLPRRLTFPRGTTTWLDVPFQDGQVYNALHRHLHIPHRGDLWRGLKATLTAAEDLLNIFNLYANSSGRKLMASYRRMWQQSSLEDEQCENNRSCPWPWATCKNANKKKNGW